MLCKQYIVICGPTGIGKTQLSIKIAEKLNGQVISADSRQIYRHMNIGTAKPDRLQLDTICHHFIDIIDPNQTYSAGVFAQEAKSTIKTIKKKNQLAIVVGGSGLYIQALVDGLDKTAEVDPNLRETLANELREKGIQYLSSRLAKLDRWAHARIETNDTARILRALEIAYSGKIQHQYWNNNELPQYTSNRPLIFGLTMKREQLYRRLDNRVDAMMNEGFLTEVEHLIQLGYNVHDNALNTFGYRELLSYLNGKIKKRDAIDLIKRQTRNYAKRQFTWFRKDRRIRWFNLDQLNINGVVGRIEAELNWRKDELS